MVVLFGNVLFTGLNIQKSQDNIPKSTYTIEESLVSGKSITGSYLLPKGSTFHIAGHRGIYRSYYSYECGRWTSATCTRPLTHGAITLDNIEEHSE